MARTTPRVAGATLIARADDARTITVGTPAWYTWLEGATTFAFVGAGGSFTARKERRRADGYWKAYRKRAGVVRSAYLGKSADLTLERLQTAAATLAELALPAAALARSDINRAPSDSAPSMRAASTLPDGTLTFCFTDIAGSTQLWEQHPQAMPAALALHELILRNVIESYGGVVFKTVGDGVHAVFTRVCDALPAAQAAQAALHAEPWGATGPLQVRMALHTGVAEQRDGDYFGAALNRVARILALGHGGQILLSRATHDLVADDLPAQTILHDLGEHQLKGLGRSERIFQLMMPDLPSKYPPLRAQEAQPVQPAPEAAPLLGTKLYIPVLRPQLVPRPRLLARLTAGLAEPLTLLSAPAGFGKTSLVSAWHATAHGRTVPLAWVSIDSADRDPARFWSYVITALDKLLPGLAAEILPAIQFAPAAPIEGLLTRVLNALTRLPADAVLVLDDYHVIDSTPIHQAVAFLLDHLPARLHLLITTRADPPLPLARLRARADLTELRAADLRFTPDEVATFLTEVMGLPLTSDEVAALEARTEGWIAGLQLAALALRDRADHAGFVATFTGSNRFIVDYLLAEVLDQLPAHLQQFVLQTSILQRLCGSLCDAVLGIGEREGSSKKSLPTTQPQPVIPGTAYSQPLLLELERINLFVIPLDDERRWYRYHHLFAEVLHERLQSGAAAERVVKLHQRASAWFAHHDLVPEAIPHALAAQDWEYVADLVEHHGRPLILGGQVTTVLSWIDALPASLMTARPRLATIHAALLMYTNQFDAAETCLQNAEDWVQADTPAEEAQLVLGQVATVRGGLLRFAGDMARSVAFAHQALDLLPEAEVIGRAGAMVNAAHAFLVHGQVTAAVEQAVRAIARPAQASGNLFATLRSFTLLARLYVLQGRLTQATACYQQAVQIVPDQEVGLPALVGSADYYAGLGDLLRERNELDRAESLLQQCVAQLRGTYAVEAEIVTVAYLALARLQHARGILPVRSPRCSGFLTSPASVASLWAWSSVERRYRRGSAWLRASWMPPRIGRRVVIWMLRMPATTCRRPNTSRWRVSTSLNVGASPGTISLSCSTCSIACSHWQSRLHGYTA
jgi:LuxR family maltose regulon positive regulatory protein